MDSMRMVEEEHKQEQLSLNIKELENSPHPETSLSKERYLICQKCDRFNNTFKLCKECNCFMPLKVRIPKSLHNIKCPIGKW